MSLIKNVNGVFHHIRAKLYPNYLPKGKELIARTANDAFLSIEDVCAALKDRGGFSGNYQKLVEGVKEFFDEAAYQLCDGFGINMEYFTIQPNIGGTFDSVLEPVDREKHPVTFRFRLLSKFRKLADHILIDIDGLAGKTPFIDKFKDIKAQSENTCFTPGALFSIYGYKIKASGEDPACGVFFVPVDDPSAEVRVEDLAENSPSKIIGIAPDTGHVQNRIEIRTQYTGSSNKLLTKPRVITSRFVLETA
jgi:hypothetical protein